MNDYERIAKVIHFLDESHQDQPNLDRLAAEVGLSPHHFHRLFSDWAGVTPKAFLRCLSHVHAKQVLASGSSVLDASMDLGFSGPSRLHDLCVDLEAATPGDVKSGGEGWTIRYGFADSPFGRFIIGENHRGICHLTFTDELPDQNAVDLIQEEWPTAVLERDDGRANELAKEIFQLPDTEEKRRVIKAFVKGTPMQIKVWQALLKIPSGELTTYGDLAASIDLPRAARAAGTAVGSNPIAYLIPCHRVIRKTGALGGYRWGLDRKKAMIARESAVLEDGGVD